MCVWELGSETKGETADTSTGRGFWFQEEVVLWGTDGKPMTWSQSVGSRDGK